MKQIIFRAKRKDNGEWAQGSVIYDPDLDTYEILHYEHHVEGVTLYRDDLTHEVDPDTIGQFIWLRDKNQNMSFVGDIVRDTEGNLYSIYAGPGGFGLCRTNKIAGNSFQTFTPLCDMKTISWYAKNIETIGNVHDNPDILQMQ